MTAREKLTQIVQQRKWYGDVFSKSTAGTIKARVLNTNPNSEEQITNERIVEVLKELGHEPKQTEAW